MNTLNYPYVMFVLKENFIKYFGEHYPFELVKYIIMLTYVRVKVYSGLYRELILTGGDIYSVGRYCFKLLSKFELSDVKSIKIGLEHTLALTHTGNIYAWGNNSYGQLGLGHTDYGSQPQKLELSNVKKIGCGINFSFALTSDNKFYIWGSNNIEFAGYVTDPDKTTPQQFVPSKHPEYYFWDRSDVFKSEHIQPYHIKKIAYGISHVFMLMTSGQLYVFGSNAYGQLGISDSYRQLDAYDKYHVQFQKISLGSVVAIKCGAYHTVALSADSVYSWGRNTDGQLGLGDTKHRFVPRELTSLKNYRIVSVGCGAYHTIALDRTGQLYVWGANAHNQLGLGHKNSIYYPQKLSFQNVIRFSCHTTRTIAVTTLNQIYRWGDDHDVPNKLEI